VGLSLSPFLKGEEAMNADIFDRRTKAFVLWRGATRTALPTLVIGRIQLGAPVTFVNEQRHDLQSVDGFPDLWALPADACGLADGQVYHYWFEVTDAHPQRSGKRVKVTDPMAFSVDWRLMAPLPDGPGYSDDDRYPAAVIKYSNGRLIPVTQVVRPSTCRTNSP
jgi:pullulanase